MSCALGVTGCLTPVQSRVLWGIFEKYIKKTTQNVNVSSHKAMTHLFPHCGFFSSLGREEA